MPAKAAAKAAKVTPRGDAPWPPDGTVRFTWGDQSTPTTVAASVAEASHTYATIGTFTIDTAVFDGSGTLWGQGRAVFLATEGDGGTEPPAPAPPAPHIDSIEPPTGDANSSERTAVTLHGSGFSGSTGTIFFGSASGNALNVQSDSLVTANTPFNQPPGAVAISLSFPGHGAIEATGAQFEFVAGPEPEPEPDTEPEDDEGE